MPPDPCEIMRNARDSLPRPRAIRIFQWALTDRDRTLYEILKPDSGGFYRVFARAVTTAPGAPPTAGESP